MLYQFYKKEVKKIYHQVHNIIIKRMVLYTNKYKYYITENNKIKEERSQVTCKKNND